MIFKSGDRVTINKKTMSTGNIIKFEETLKEHGGYLVVHSMYDEKTGSINFDENVYGSIIGGRHGWMADRFILYKGVIDLFKEDDFIL